MSEISEEKTRPRSLESGIRRSSRDPQRTRERILKIATAEFSEKGFDGARVDSIALRSRVSKNMIYYYFTSKEDLFIAVLENAYQRFRESQAELTVRVDDPVESMRDLIHHTFYALIKQPEFIRLINEENLYKASHIKKSKRIQQLYDPLFHMLQGVLQHGVSKGIFRPIDPKILYLSLSSLAYHYVSNQYTLEVALEVPLTSETYRQLWLDNITEMMIRHLAPLPGIIPENAAGQDGPGHLTSRKRP